MSVLNSRNFSTNFNFINSLEFLLSYFSVFGEQVYFRCGCYFGFCVMRTEQRQEKEVKIFVLVWFVKL